MVNLDVESLFTNVPFMISLRSFIGNSSLRILVYPCPLRTSSFFSFEEHFFSQTFLALPRAFPALLFCFFLCTGTQCPVGCLYSYILTIPTMVKELLSHRTFMYFALAILNARMMGLIHSLCRPLYSPRLQAYLMPDDHSVGTSTS